MDTLAELPRDYPGSSGTSFDAFARTLASTIPCSISPIVRSSATEKDHSRDAFTCSASDSFSHAPFWLCEILERESWSSLEKLREKLDQATDSKRESWEVAIQKLVIAYHHLCFRYPDLPWSKSIDREVDPAECQYTAQGTSDIVGQLLDMGIVKVGEIIDEITNKRDDAIVKKTPWSGVFETNEGLLGMGPKWLHDGDQLMIVKGAAVPYIFRCAEKHREALIETQRAHITNLESSFEKLKQSQPWKRVLSTKAYRKAIAEAKERLEELQVPFEQPNSWILIGEAYVEGVMRGEAVAEGGDHLFERIAIV
ncbi:hypothetical protein P170DRAFT_436071 [Aspergillus steynii IBT 23096]|uniref:Uncharacterized protein n=1 Tax=Aspergillus steynii IBT 23096 TaxID=1392250 RepID=A0A2I2GDP5_9EURO|nr:uncharacterized protein P170DRAFT_436071 [Aspergillus steynii IBT 23096]PLB50992.1 hypothetical protein P170DRAFT_436071 [Aspergillus steynii IBT 23096]